MKMTISRKLTTACALGLVMIGALGATPAMARHHRDDYRPGDYYRGGLLGNEVARQGDRTTGAVIGAAVGAIAGHAIDKGDGRRC